MKKKEKKPLTTASSLFTLGDAFDGEAVSAFPSTTIAELRPIEELKIASVKVEQESIEPDYDFLSELKNL